MFHGQRELMCHFPYRSLRLPFCTPPALSILTIDLLRHPHPLSTYKTNWLATLDLTSAYKVSWFHKWYLSPAASEKAICASCDIVILWAPKGLKTYVRVISLGNLRGTGTRFQGSPLDSRIDQLFKTDQAGNLLIPKSILRIKLRGQLRWIHM